MKPRPLALLLALLLGFLFGAYLCWVAPPIPAGAQGVGIFGTSATGTRTNCTQITNPVQGQTVCFDQAKNRWQVWTGAAWVGEGNASSVSVTEYGALCDGVTDDTVAIRTALNTAATTGIGKVTVPSNTLGCNFTSTIVLPRGIALEGAGGGAASIANSGSTAFLNHAFNGTGLQLDGSGAGNVGSGYSMRNLAIRQTNGAGANTSGDGTAIRIVCTSANTRATWVRLENVNIEEGSGNNPWTIGIDVDGTGCYGLGITNTVRDVWIIDGRVQVGATAGTPFGLRTRFAANVFVQNMEFTNFANVQFTGQAGSESNSILVSNSQGPTFAVDFVTNLIDIGGQWTTFTNTANAAGPVVLYPLYITNAFTNNAPTKIMVAQFNTSVLGGQFNQGWNLGTPLLMGNGNSGGVGFLNAAGTSYEPALQLDGLNRIQMANSTNIASILAFKTFIQNTAGMQIGAPTLGDRGTGTINVASSVLLNGVPVALSGTPTCSDKCGTAPTVAGNNTFMRVTMGASGTPATPFLVLFSGARNAIPSCLAQIDTPGTTAATVTRANASATGVLINTGTGATAINPPNSAVYSIHCEDVG